MRRARTIKTALYTLYSILHSRIDNQECTVFWFQQVRSTSFTWGAFHSTKNSGTFERKTNENKMPENPKIMNFRNANHSTENSGNSVRKIKWIKFPWMYGWNRSLWQTHCRHNKGLTGHQSTLRFFFGGISLHQITLQTNKSDLGITLACFKGRWARDEFRDSAHHGLHHVWGHKELVHA